MTPEREPLRREYGPVNRTVVLFRRRFLAASVILSLSVVAGCSGDAAPGISPDDLLAREYGITKSELRALRKANKGPKNLEKVLLEKKVDKLRTDGLLQTTSPKTTKKRH